MTCTPTEPLSAAAAASPPAAPPLHAPQPPQPPAATDWYGPALHHWVLGVVLLLVAAAVAGLAALAFGAAPHLVVLASVYGAFAAGFVIAVAATLSCRTP